MKGYLQIYTGDGKGKTTAALGLIVRAAGAGLRVYLGQFLKARASSELALLRNNLPDVRVEQFGTGRFVRGKPSAREIEAARRGLARLEQALRGGEYDLVVADELNNVVDLGMLDVEPVLAVVDSRPRNVELVITGRAAHPRLIERAGLVTEMRKIKHYFDTGVKARKGIEQ